MKFENMIAWLGAAVDCDGTITVVCHKRKHFKERVCVFPVIGFYNKNEKLVRTAAGVMKTISPETKSSPYIYLPTEVWRFQVCSFSGVKKILEKILPFLIAKKEIAKLLIQLCSLRKDHKFGTGYSKEEKLLIKEIRINQLKKAKHAKWIDNWLKN